MDQQVPTVSGIAMRTLISANDPTCRCGRSKLPGAWSCEACNEDRSRKYDDMIESKLASKRFEFDGILKNCGFPEKYRTAAVTSLDLVPQLQQFAVGVAAKPRNLFFKGIPGSGKTHVAAAILKEWIWRKTERDVRKNADPEHTLPGAFINVPEFLAHLRTMGYRDSFKQVEHVARKRFLVIDDLGAEKTTDHTLDILYAIINNRYGVGAKGRWYYATIVTSEFSIVEISTKVHDRLARRLTEMCQVIQFPNKDLSEIVRKREQEKETDENNSTDE